MEVIVNRNALVEVLSAAAGIAASRSVKDLLRCTRLDADGAELLVTATDLEVGMRVRVQQVEVRKAGEMLVPVEKLMQIARESSDDTLVLEGDGERCHVRGRDSHFEVYTRDPKEFPPVPDLEGEGDAEVEAKELLGLLERTVFAAARENTRYAINGVLWEKKGKKLTLVGTDGRRLACASTALAKGAARDRQMIVPVKMMGVLQRILPYVEGPVVVQFGENQVLVRAGAYVVSSVLVEGRFPQYEEILPRDNDRHIEMPVEDFLSAVRRAALLTNQQSKGIRLQFSQGRLVLSSRAPEEGEATVSMDIDYAQPDLEIGFNPAYLVEALRVAGTPTVTVELKDSARPGLLRAGPGFVYLVMPVSLV